MLRSLSIRDFVLVESLDLDFAPGMTVLTGETGAGKSILVGALSLVLGDRAESGVVRHGARRAEISAEFALENLPSVQAWLIQNGLDAEQDCLLRRTVEAEGRSRAFINGSSVTLAQLKELGEQLVDIHGQHAHHALLKAGVQRGLLDEFAGAHTEAAVTAQAWQAWQAAKKTLQAAREEAGVRLLEREGLEAALAEVGPALDDLRAWDEMQSEHGRQAHMSSLIETSAQLLAGLEDEEDGVLRRLGRLHGLMQDMLEKDASLAEERALLEAALSDLEETRHGLRRYADRLSLDPERLAELDRRMAEVHRLSRKHRLSPAELLERHAEWLRRLEQLAAEDDIEALQAEVVRAEKTCLASAGKLSEKRRRAAQALSKTVSLAMADLSLADGRFEVRLVACEPHAHGQEEIFFLVASHATLAPGPLDKVASGGELSRISLAIQTALSGQAGVPSLIFDEVDVGIGGAVAEAVGRRLAQLARSRQVLVVTHLPQVAACGSQHLRVSKLAGDDKVVSQVMPLGGEERVMEIARMLGGQEITETTLKHAREMLETVGSAKNTGSRKKTA
ncbi:DNA repair protein RecN [Betaproteobacteria bacterium SCN2]|jgi:DNA repair protein RecN (Recombination protein N)|nr:DNA repair protein RecN [Betaproteobacteria bacterium SCN2]